MTDKSAAVAVAILFLLVIDVSGLRWYLEPNTDKCLKEEIQANVLISGEYEVSEATGQTVNYIVSIFFMPKFLYTISIDDRIETILFIFLCVPVCL